MSAVLASYVKMSTLVDGTMRIVLDVEPGAAADAFSLLGSPGTSIALARITKEAAVAHDRRQQQESVNEGSRPASASPASERRSIALAGRVKLACDRSDFYDWLRQESAYEEIVIEETDALAPQGGNVYFQDISEAVVKRLCGVERKRDIIPGTPAAERWQDIWFQFTHSGQGRAA